MCFFVYFFSDLVSLIIGLERFFEIHLSVKRDRNLSKSEKKFDSKFTQKFDSKFLQLFKEKRTGRQTDRG